MAGTRRIAQLQNVERSLTLLRAISAAHRHTQRAQGATLAISVLVAGLGVLTKPFPAVSSAIALTGAVWGAMYALVIRSWTGRYLHTSATLQEMFDVGLFNLPWNAVAVGDRVPDDEVSRLSRRYRGDESRLRDYYIVANVPAPYDVLFCLEQNLAWGSRVRSRFANAIVALVVFWCAAGTVTAVATGSTVNQLLSEWFVPSLGLLLLCLDTYRVQVSITRERSRMLNLLRSAVDDPASTVLATAQTFTGFARQIQDALFQMRRQQPRVPTWFFRRFHDSDATDFRFKMQALEARFGDATHIIP